MIISVSNHADRIRLIAIETMKGAFGNEGALRFFLEGQSRIESSMHLPQNALDAHGFTDWSLPVSLL